MIAIDNVLLSEELFEKKFLCDLLSCKGVCCVEGESGAPLLEEELTILDDIFEEVKPFLRSEGIEAIEKNGKYNIDPNGDYVTTLVKGKECAYTVFTDKGIAQCGIEKAFQTGAIDFRKPISCHLYPARIKELKEVTAVNFHQWKICEAACACGEQMDVPVFKFLQSALVRKFGEPFFKKLETFFSLWQKQDKRKIHSSNK